MIMPATFTAAIVRLNTELRLAQELVDASQGQAVESARMDLAFALAAFLAKQYVTEHKTPAGIELRINLDMLVAQDKVPAGLAHTKIIFQEQSE